MVPSRQPLLLGRALCLSLLLAQSAPSFAQAAKPSCDPWVARLISYQGDLRFRRSAPGATPVSAVSLNDTFCVGDVLEVGAFSRAALQLPDQTVLRLDQGTVVTFAAPQDDKRSWLEILKGVLHVISRDPRAIRVVTPFANAGIEGTEFLVQVGPDSASVLVFEGRVRVENANGAATAGSGESVLAKAGSAPVLQQVVRPRDQVVWTLYYPPTGRSVDPQVARADELLAVGRVSEAGADLAAVLARSPGNSEALARQSVIALTRNDPAMAGALADEAVASNPASSSARLAQSYVRQSAGDLSGAIATLEAAAASQPGNALVLARLAELHLASGDLDRGEEKARAAVAADPVLSLAHTILGFAKLTRVQLDAARASFDEAIRLEPGTPLPRLGLGLARIRDGDLAGGREELETAVILDPNNSLVRSYMGKAYYDEKRDALAASQLGIAKELDPNDPTPWFYDAIRKQAGNRPLEALEDLEAAIARNDNRSVYRSRLDLDQDLAARSASQGRIYGDLGFEELAQRSGARSAAAFPADFSGHRLLADSYAAQPRHEIARVNELFQSQVLQPLNVNPVQAQLGESNLFIIDSAGPSAAAFNEFNPLFNRDRLTAQVSAVVGNLNTMGADAVLAGVEGRMSFSLGAYTLESDGFRENNDQDERTYNAFFQFQQSPDTSWLAEVRDTTRDFGELKVLFLPGIDAGLPRQSEDSTNFRVGVRHDLSPRSTVGAFFNYGTGDLGVTSLEPNITVDVPFDTYTGELQHLYTAERWRLVTGLRALKGDFDSSTTFRVTLPEPPFDLEITSEDTFTTRLVSVYSYATVDAIPEQLEVTVGLSGDWLDGQSFEKDRLNPKLGITWFPSLATEVRLGALSTLQRPSTTRREIVPSLEPTTISGFNQFFFGSEGELAERYGVGVDHKFSDRLYAGAEYSTRDLEVPYLESVFIPPDTIVDTERTADVDEKLGRAYAYWGVGDNGAIRGFYEYYDVETPVLTPLRYTRLETHRFGAGVSYFGARGFGAGITPSFIHQRGRFQELSSGPPPPFLPDSDEFWVVDAALSYRLPQRFGILRLEVNNLFDEDFRFQDIDPEAPRVAPERVVLVRMTVAY